MALRQLSGVNLRQEVAEECKGSLTLGQSSNTLPDSNLKHLTAIVQKSKHITNLSDFIGRSFDVMYVIYGTLLFLGSSCC